MLKTIWIQLMTPSDYDSIVKHQAIVFLFLSLNIKDLNIIIILITMIYFPNFLAYII